MKYMKYSKKKPSVYTAAAGKLSKKPLSVQELRKYLLDKQYEEEEVDILIREYLEIGYLNDVEYASRFWKYGEGKGWADSRIKRELLNRGVNQNDIDDGYVIWNDEDSSECIMDDSEIPGSAEERFSEEGSGKEAKRALEIARKMAASAILDEYGHLDKTLKNRIGRRLYSYGYQSSLIFGTIDIIEREIIEGEIIDKETKDNSIE